MEAIPKYIRTEDTITLILKYNGSDFPTIVLIS